MKPYPFTFGEEFKVYNTDVVKLYPGPFCVPIGFKTELPRVYDFKTREDDVWVIGCPKSGTTWLSEIVWTVCNDADTETAKKLDHFERYFFPELKAYLVTDALPEGQKFPDNMDRDQINLADKAQSRRFLRSHLPLEFLPPDLLDTCKVVYIARDPKDCCVSFYHMQKDVPLMKDLTIDGMAESFLNDTLTLGPYPLSVKQYWNKRSHKNLLFLFYEEIKLDLPGTLRRVANFFGKSLHEDQIEKLVDHLSIKTMKKNDAINMKVMKDVGIMKQENNFIRKGIIGDHKNYFTPELEKGFEEWWKKHFDDPTYKIPTEHSLTQANIKDYPFSFGEEFKQYNQDFVKLYPGPFSVPIGFKTELPRVYDFKSREDDVWVIGCPKSGTTWLSEIVWTVCNDADTEKAKSLEHFDRYVFPEIKGYLQTELLPDGQKFPEQIERDQIMLADNAKSPRFLRSHLPLEFLPPDLLDTCKVVYIARDPKDCCVSLYHMQKDVPIFKDLTVDGMADCFLDDKVMMGPYPLSVKQYWNKRSHKNLLFLFYEEIKLDLPGTLRKVAKFCGKTLSDQQIEKLVDHLSVKSMKKNDAINMKLMRDSGFMKPENSFIRKGVIGDHKNHFTPELEKRFEQWWKQHFDDPTYKIPTQ